MYDELLAFEYMISSKHNAPAKCSSLIGCRKTSHRLCTSTTHPNKSLNEQVMGRAVVLPAGRAIFWVVGSDDGGVKRRHHHDDQHQTNTTVSTCNFAVDSKSLPF